jgi:hypothetical protein
MGEICASGSVGARVATPSPTRHPIDSPLAMSDLSDALAIEAAIKSGAGVAADRC